MTDTYNLLKEELKVYYPGVTDTELNEMTSNLIDYYKTAIKVVLRDEFNKIEEAIPTNRD